MADVPERRTRGTLAPAPPEAIFAPVRSYTAFEETVDRLATPIKLGLLAPGSRLPAEREAALEDFGAFRQADIRLHVGLAEATRSARLIRTATEVQGAMSDLIAYISHPPQVLASSNAQHRRLLAAVRERDGMRAVQAM